MKRTLNTIIADILTQHNNDKFSAHDLAEIIVKTEHEFVNKKIKRTKKTGQVLVFQLMSEIGAQYPKLRINFPVARTKTRPVKYFYKPKLQKAVKAEEIAAAKPAAKAAVKAPAKKTAAKKVTAKKTVAKKATKAKKAAAKKK